MIGHGQQVENINQGGAEEIHPPPVQAANFDLHEALKATPIMESVNFVYGICDNYLPWITGYDVAFDIAVEKAFVTAV